MPCGKTRGLRRYRCKSCGRTFGTLHIQTVNSRHKPDQGLPRHRHQVPGQLSEVVPPRRARQASIAVSLPRGGQRQDRHAIHELSQEI